jgi:uncharacterized protein YgiM (DUF1202 family)
LAYYTTNDSIRAEQNFDSLEKKKKASLIGLGLCNNIDEASIIINEISTYSGTPPYMHDGEWYAFAFRDGEAITSIFSAFNPNTTDLSSSSLVPYRTSSGIQRAYVDSPDGLNLRDAPSTDGNIITALRDKTEMSVSDYDPTTDWFYVTANGYSGWVKSEYIVLR